ncbi:MAG: hypothetical protein ACI8QC_000270 [Planctomycetota bacterium]
MDTGTLLGGFACSPAQPLRSRTTVLFPRKKKKNNKDDGRSQYRVRIRNGFTVQTQVGEEPPEVQLLDVSSRGTDLFVLEQDLADFEEGRTLDLVFTPETGSRGIRARARIQDIETLETQFGSGARIGMPFTDQKALFEQLDADLWGYFNRRGAYRSKQPPGEIKLKYRSGTLSGYLADISTRGFSLVLERGSSILLLPAHPAEAKFQIPGTSPKAKAEFVATTIYRLAFPDSNAWRLGCSTWVAPGAWPPPVDSC